MSRAPAWPAGREPVPLYHVRLMFEWRGGSLGCGNDAARDAFGVGHIEDELPLSDATRQRLEELSVWHDTALDWDDPGGCENDIAPHSDRAVWTVSKKRDDMTAGPMIGQSSRFRRRRFAVTTALRH